jgi:class 3 adenylate cyclase
LSTRKFDRFRGRELDTAGDGFFAAFDEPIRAIRCAHAFGEAVGLEVRAGLHTGECQVVGTKLSGLAVNIGARITTQAGAGRCSSTVKDLVAGSGPEFDERGTAELKGAPGRFELYAARR